jgi:hypothetical protein
LAGGCDRGGVVMDCQLIRQVRMARNAEISRLRGTSIAFALFSIKRFSLINYFSRSRGYRGLLSSICHDYNYRSNDELRLRSILPYHDTTYLCLSWASITYTYDDMYTRVGRHHEGG